MLAVTLLGVEHGVGRVALTVIEGRGNEITDLLQQIPVTKLHKVAAQTIGEGSAAWDLWELLRTSGGGNLSVIACKLLARKRPALLPIYDSVVWEQLGKPHDIWRCYWTWFDEDRSRVEDTAALRDEVGGVGDISLLRCLDVALWMFGDEERRRAMV